MRWLCVAALVLFLGIVGANAVKEVPRARRIMSFAELQSSIWMTERDCPTLCDASCYAIDPKHELSEKNCGGCLLSGVPCGTHMRQKQDAIRDRFREVPDPTAKPSELETVMKQTEAKAEKEAVVADKNSEHKAEVKKTEEKTAAKQEAKAEKNQKVEEKTAAKQEAKAEENQLKQEEKKEAEMEAKAENQEVEKEAGEAEMEAKAENQEVEKEAAPASPPSAHATPGTPDATQSALESALQIRKVLALQQTLMAEIQEEREERDEMGAGRFGGYQQPAYMPLPMYMMGSQPMPYRPYRSSRFTHRLHDALGTDRAFEGPRGSPNSDAIERLNNNLSALLNYVKTNCKGQCSSDHVVEQAGQIVVNHAGKATNADGTVSTLTKGQKATKAAPVTPQEDKEAFITPSLLG